MLCYYFNAQSWSQRAEAECVLTDKNEWTLPMWGSQGWRIGGGGGHLMRWLRSGRKESPRGCDSGKNHQLLMLNCLHADCVYTNFKMAS